MFSGRNYLVCKCQCHKTTGQFFLDQHFHTRFFFQGVSESLKGTGQDPYGL